MLHTLEGTLTLKELRFAVVDVGGVGFRARMSGRALGKLPRLGARVKLFAHLHVREDALELYGFTAEEDLALFELLISVSGVGPKSALAIIDVAERKEIEAAIKENRPDLLTRASGVGRKTAERIIIDLKNKIVVRGAAAVVGKMETDADLVEALVGLGYGRDAAREALTKSTAAPADLSARLKDALKLLGKRGFLT